MDLSLQRTVVEQWEAAGPALREVRARELAALTDEEALRAADALLSLVPDVLPKRDDSGLVEQQRLFAQGRS